MTRIRQAARRPLRPACEPLEGRALMAASLLDPNFGQYSGQSGVVLGPVNNGAQLSNITAAAVQADGKIVVAGTYASGAFDPVRPTYPRLAVARYDADGFPDLTFGANGQFNVPLPAGSTGAPLAPRNIVIGADGTITLAATAAVTVTSGDAISTQQVGLVARLTAAGALDPTFGTGGEFFTAPGGGDLRAVAVQADGKVLAAGGSSTSDQLRVVRLTAAGVPDTSFNETGTLTVDLVDGSPTIRSNLAAAIAVTATGQIYAAGDARFPSGQNLLTTAVLARINPDGTLDTTYATNGTNRGFGVGLISDIAVQPGGDLLVAGNVEAPVPTTRPDAALVRLLPSGAVDTTFAGLGRVGSPATFRPGVSLNSLALAADGSITAAGSITPQSNNVGYVARFSADGALDASFGRGGQYSYVIQPPTGYGAFFSEPAAAVALAPGGDVIVAGALVTDDSNPSGLTGRSYVAALRPAPSTSYSNQTVANNYTGGVRSDIAVQIPALANFAYRATNNSGAGAIVPFGAAGPGATIPAPGDYDGDGVADLAAYLPTFGILAYRPSSGGTDVYVRFGSAGVGGSIPAPGDYDGDGKTDVAVYLPAFGALAVRPSTGAPNYLVPFGSAGVNGSIPAPGDYDGDGRTDVAVYLPTFGALAVRPSGGAPNFLVTFGPAGVGASIPAPGDYDGDGRTDVAVYLPAFGSFAIRPSTGAAPYFAPFGAAGVGASIPAPGDYDGDGRTDVAVYLTGPGSFAYRASSPLNFGSDVVQPFGPAGLGQSVPAASIPYAFGPTVSAASLPAPGASAGYLVALTDDLLPAAPGARKPRA